MADGDFRTLRFGTHAGTSAATNEHDCGRKTSRANPSRHDGRAYPSQYNYNPHDVTLKVSGPFAGGRPHRRVRSRHMLPSIGTVDDEILSVIKLVSQTTNYPPHKRCRMFRLMDDPVGDRSVEFAVGHHTLHRANGWVTLHRQRAI